MPDDSIDLSIDDILFEHEGVNRAQASLSRFDAVHSPGPATIRGAPSFGSPVNHGLGSELIGRCDAMTRQRGQTLSYLEKELPPELDFSILIVPACQMLETELIRLIGNPARRLGSDLPRYASQSGNRRASEILDKWLAGQLPTTLGVLSLTLLSLRHGWNQKSEPIREFLEQNFHTRYVAPLCGDLGRCLDTVRDKFRNPACHGERVFQRADYDTFIRRLFACPSFRDWLTSGPLTLDPQGAQGVLHHHLVHSLQQDGQSLEVTCQWDRLVRFASRRRHDFDISLTLSAGNDSVGGPTEPLVSVPADTPIRLNFAWRTPGDLLILDVSTTGEITTLWPNLWHHDPRQSAAGQCSFPNVDHPEAPLILTGPPGREHLVAVYSREAIPRQWLTRSPREAFGVLTADQFHALLDWLEQQPEQAVVAATVDVSVE